MRPNESDGIRRNRNTPSSSAPTQEIHLIGAPYFLTTNEEELCEYLVAKYQNQFPFTPDEKYQFQEDCRLLAHTVRRNLVNRKRISSAPHQKSDTKLSR